MLVGARHLLAEPPLAVRRALRLVDEVDGEDPACEPERGLDAVGEATLAGRLRHEPVDDDLDRVLELLLEQRRLGQRHHLAVDPGPREALALQLAEQVGVLPLAAPHDRREHLETGALGQLEQPVDDLLRGLPGDRLTADRAMRAPGAGPEQAQVVVDLGDGADRRAGVAVRGLLVDRDRRREAFDEVDVGLVHLAEELPGVRRQRLDVPALALREDRVERQGGLAGAGQAGEHHQGVPGQLQGHVLQVVLTGTADDQSVAHKSFSRARRGGLRGQRPHARWRVRQTLPGRGKRPTAGCRGCQRRGGPRHARGGTRGYRGAPRTNWGGPLWRTRVR